MPRLVFQRVRVPDGRGGFVTKHVPVHGAPQERRQAPSAEQLLQQREWLFQRVQGYREARKDFVAKVMRETEVERRIEGINTPPRPVSWLWGVVFVAVLFFPVSVICEMAGFYDEGPASLITVVLAGVALILLNVWRQFRWRSPEQVAQRQARVDEIVAKELVPLRVETDEAARQLDESYPDLVDITDFRVIDFYAECLRTGRAFSFEECETLWEVEQETRRMIAEEEARRAELERQRAAELAEAERRSQERLEQLERESLEFQRHREIMDALRANNRR